MKKKIFDLHIFKKRSKVYYSFIASYLIFSIILIAISFSYASMLRKKLLIEYNNSYSYTLSVFKDEFSKMTESLNLTVSLMLKNTDNYNISDILSENYISKSAMANFSDVLISNNQYVTHLGIYFPVQNKIFSNRGFQSPSDYFTVYYNKDDNLCSKWIETLSDRRSYNMYEYLGTKYIYYTYNINVGSVPAVIFSCANLQKYYDQIKDIYNSTNANIVIYNSNSNIYLTNDEFKQVFQKYLDTGKPDLNVLKSSGAPGWTIYLLNDDAFYTKSVRNLNILMYLVIVAYFLIVIFMTRYFSARHYAPIHGLAEKLNADIPKEKNNEFLFLQSSIENLVSKNNAYTRKNTLNEKISKLKNIVSAKSENRKNTLAELSFDTKDSALWTIAIIKITDLSGEKMKSAGYTQYDIDTIFVNICSEILNDEYRSAVFPIENKYCCIINSDKIDKASLENCLLKIMKNINYYFSVNFTICVSPIQNGCDSIPELYKKAYEIMSITDFLRPEQSDIRFYDDLAFSAIHKVSNSSMTNKLIQFVYDNKPEKAAELLNAVIDTSMNNITSAEQFNKITHELLILLSHTVNLIFKNNDDPVPDEYEPIHKILPYKNLNELKDNINKYFVSLCAYAQDNGRDVPLEEKIAKYIKDNYSNPNLDATMICEIFHIHNTHLSRLFSEKFNIGMHQYLTNLRINKAKELLKDSSEKIDNIAIAVGYNNIYSFSRAFKRITGTTPRQFRTDNYK